MILIIRLTSFVLKKLKQGQRLGGFFSLKKFIYLLKLSLYSFLFFMLLIGLEVGAAGFGMYKYYAKTLPEPSKLAMESMPESTRIYDRNGEFLYEVHGDVKRRFVSFKDIPDFVKEATVAIEDRNFYKHGGFDFQAIIRAALINFKNKEITQGASTITQQLARTLFLDQDKVYSRKIKEVILALEIERRYTKDEILEMYLNNVPYGSVAYGISAASEIYLDKDVEDLTLIEAAYLAALPKAPTDYSPFGGNREKLDARARAVIRAMQRSGYLEEVEALDVIMHERPNFVSSPTVIKAPHFVFYVLDELEKKFGKAKIRGGGLNIYTTLDLTMQEKAEEIVAGIGEDNEKKWGASNASLVSLDPRTGEILVMVGSRDYFEDKTGAFNVSTSPRQPGSSFKPYVYAAAIANGLSPESYIIDNRTNFARFNNGVEYIPRNYNGKYYGALTVRRALAGSLNIPAVKVLVNTGIDKTLDLAEGMGLSTLEDRNRFGPSLALGGGEVKLLEHTSALGTFGNEGRKMPLSSVLKISDRDGEIVYKSSFNDGRQVVDEATAYWINNILSDTKARQYVFGRNSKLEIPGFSVAAKTGTTQDYHDAWTIGYTPGLATGVWSGNNDNRPMYEGANGYVVATPIWREFMIYALKDRAPQDFAKPDDLMKLSKFKPGYIKTDYYLSAKKTEKEEKPEQSLIESYDESVENFLESSHNNTVPLMISNPVLEKTPIRD